tara:strand:- start:6899 stop:7954 length:1056 start_codon:yes stop_codon:yes gene_type:complete
MEKTKSKQFQKERFAEIKQAIASEDLELAEYLIEDEHTCESLQTKARGALDKKKTEIAKRQKATRFKDNKFVAVDSDEGDGAIVFWKGASHTDRQSVADALAKHLPDIDVDTYIPKEATPVHRLRSAIVTLPKRKYNKHSLGQGKWAISEWEVTNSNTVGISYDPQLKATIESGELRFSDSNHPLVPVVKEVFEQQEGLILGDSIRDNIRNFIERECNAVPMACIGGAHYVPEASLDLWRSFAEAMVEVMPATLVREITVCKSERTVEAIANSFIDEATSCIDKASKQMDEGRGKRAMSNRDKDLHSCLEKLQGIKSYLGVSLEKIESKLQATQVAVVTAAAQRGNKSENV